MLIESCVSVTAYTMDANEAQEEYEEVQTELRKKEEEVSGWLSATVKLQGDTERNETDYSVHRQSHTAKH